MTCIFWSVATQMKGSGSIKTRPSKTEPGAEAWGENFNEINLEIQWSQAMKESQEKTFAPYHGINNLNDKKNSIVILLQFNWICAAVVLTFCLTLMGWHGMIQTNAPNFYPILFKIVPPGGFCYSHSISVSCRTAQTGWVSSTERREFR